MKYRRLLPFRIALLWIAFVTPQSGFGQLPATIDTAEYYPLEDNYPAQSLFAKTKILSEGEQWTIEDILNGKTEGLFQPLNPEQALLDHPDTIWLQVKIWPKINIENWWLLFKKNKKQNEYVTEQDQVDAYFVRQGQVIRHTRTGLYVPASQKDLAEYVSISRIRVDFQQDQPVDIYLHIKDKNSIFTLLELRDPELFELPPLAGYVSNTRFASVATLVIGIYVLFFFFYTYDWSFLYLFGMLSCLFFHYQILHPYALLIDWFFPEHPQWIELAWIFLTRGSFVFFLQFGRTYTNIKRLSPFWDKVMIWNIYLIIAVVAIMFGLWWAGSPLYSYFDYSSTLIFAIFPLIIVIRLSFFRDKLVRYFIFGAAWLFFFTILGVLWNLDIIPFFEVPNPWIISQVGFMFIYALALAYKIQISERARSEVEQVKAIDSIKSRFFANISHEFRTPLSLILGPVNQTLENIPASEVIEDDTEIPIRGKYLKVIKRNALRLQNLIDQILDLSKLDRGRMHLQIAQGDIIQFIRSIVFSFESLAEKKHIHFRTHFPQSLEEAWFDRDKLEKILVNLLSNAFKFTPEHGEVSVQVSTKGKLLKIIVSDTGSGMKPDEVEKIFERFYQVEGTQDQGTGIGLSLVKELVELHHGQISVESVEGQSTTFKVVLPFQKSDFRDADITTESRESGKTWTIETLAIPETNSLQTENGVPAADLPLVLVVEDNADLRHYISEQLAKNYKIILASDGQQGLQMAEALVPDLIISDVMMPKMNGIELCNAVKNNVKTSHIPLILLTAKADQDAKIEGLQTGADAYLTKPFDGRELRVRCLQLIEQRKQLREKYAGEFRLAPTAVSLNSMDEQFLQQVKDAIEKNMDNEYFSVEDLAGAVGFSRSQLNRKLKGLTDKSPNQLIREFRMNRAKELLEQKTGSVSEIAYQVGYSNLSYFSRSYKEAFGISPSEVS